jgi:hypothetical protein
MGGILHNQWEVRFILGGPVKLYLTTPLLVVNI